MINRQLHELGKAQHPAIAERLSEDDDGNVTFNGMKFAFAHSSRVNAFKTHNRLGEHPKGSLGNSQRIVAGIRDDLRTGVGLNNPLVLGYNVPKSALWLDEGHHRLEAAHKEGLLVPVVGHSSNAVPTYSQNESLGALKVNLPDEVKPDQYGWSPSTADPSRLMGGSSIIMGG